MTNTSTVLDVLVLGGGQAGLATSYFLRRHKLDHLVLDGETTPGGAWRHGWESLHLFSPEKWSSLPGWPMPKSSEEWPPRDHVIDYLTEYERRYRLPVERPVEIKNVTAEDEWLRVHTDHSDYLARAVVSATGTWRHPFVPDYPGQSAFQGRQIHSGDYLRPDDFRDQLVLIVGGGNSGA